MISKKESPCGEQGLNGKKNFIFTQEGSSNLPKSFQRINIKNLELQAISVLAEKGLLIERVDCSGRFVRCPTVTKPKSKNGAYKVFSDVPPTVWWQNWETGEKGAFKIGFDQRISHAELKAFRDAWTQERSKREKEKQESYIQGAIAAKNTWEYFSEPVTTHSYLRHKGILSYGLKQNINKTLCIPIWNENFQIQSLQYIFADGSKKFMAKGRLSGGFFPISNQNKNLATPLLLCEGYATGASLHEATGYSILVSFTAENLSAIATFARGKFPSRKMILCADNDSENPSGNIGVKKATEVCFSIGGILAVCPSIDGKNTDFNDYHQVYGLKAVREIIEAAGRK